MKSKRNKIRVILFDIGGVLVELSGLAMLLSWLGHSVTAEHARTLWLTSPAVRLFETGKMQPPAFAQQMITELGLRVSSEEFLTELYGRSQQILPGAVELVRRIPRIFVRATLCNTNALQWPRVMEQDDLIGVFDHHFASHLTGKIKPDEEAFRHVLATLGCEGPETLFLDDSQLNIAAAKRVGMTAFQVQGPVEAEQALREAAVLPA
jgi:HAD superfamily hydrolase (TIGR01509 family)